MSERTEYTLPGEHIWLGTDGLWYGDGEHGKTLAEQLDAMERSYKERAEECAEGLAAVRRIRVEAGLGGLEWEGSAAEMYSTTEASVANGMLRLEMTRYQHNFSASWCAGPHVTRIDVCDTEAVAKAACEQWFADWLERAGLEVRR